MLDCNFENGFCKWGNDYNNWKLNWKQTAMNEIGFLSHRNVENGGACLKTLTGVDETLLTARLWSPEVMKNVKLGCFSFQYRIEGNGPTKLTLMRREMG